jgi:uncharacterized protein (DUF427 family)
MPRAICKGVVIADADETVTVEGNRSFPPESVDHRYLRNRERTSVRPWKGRASYVDVVVDGDPAAGWRSPRSEEAARQIAGPLACWHAVTVEP